MSYYGFLFLKYSAIIKARSIFCFITTLFTSVLTVNFIREFHSVTHGFFMLPWKENQMNFFTVSTTLTGIHMAKHLPSILP